ncbi:MAG: C25 family cysteine peptidase, partial [Bacteroidota bacterium]|nr:C25 family cysteine peptidase [Bacteroidota bacterium]
MKRILLMLFISLSLVTQAQVYNNEWIDYNKTYYKFKIAVDSLYRISQSSLSSIGLGNTPAEDFQLWRNGQQVPIFTSVTTGSLSASDYIEFWGQMNDGKPDNALYRNTDFQLSDKWSLQTDTAAYFLTVNTAGNNLRLITTPNNVASNVLPAEQYFMHTTGTYYRYRINGGRAENVGEYLFSSSYDKGEGWSSNDIDSNSLLTSTQSNLFVYTAGPDATINYSAFGNTVNQRRVGVNINGVVIDTTQVMDYFNYVKASYPVPISILSSNTADVEFDNIATISYDRMVVAQYELIYPRQFNFGGKKNFEFGLPANASGNYLEISGFNYGSAAPVLYDITNGKRYVADISSPSLIKVVLEPSSTDRKLILVSQEPSDIASVNSFITRNFVNYTAAVNHGDYLIITNPLLYNGANGSNPVEEYRAYRSSAAGGGYNAKIYEVDELVDQFAFGIKKDPLALRNFILYARANYTTPPKFVFLIGKGVAYNQYRYYEGYPDMENLNLVPTFGTPASDNMLTAIPGSSQPQMPIGRLSVINANEVAAYLKKIKDYEATQASSSPLIADKAWMKNVVHVIGVSDNSLQDILSFYMQKYKAIISDTLFGAKVATFSKTSSDEIEQLGSTQLHTLFEEGISLLTYFGHSSSSVFQFNLDNPASYNNQGKYPVFIALGCSAGDFFNYNVARLQTHETLSEKFVLAPERGAIAFVASSHFGIVHYLDIFNSKNYTIFSNTQYGLSIG